ncbi:protrudin-like [Gigantopelta aegis]|uniref:protrudin-like n=1 Tax=Gigantopelta aegis TaxID=1735272 RepID=UPI001B88DD32|nr:protrudin-like [Gigantopelta aegis]
MGKPDGEGEKESENYVDIADFVLEVERFSKLVEPFAFVIFAIDDLRRWRIPAVSLVLWVLSTVSCILLTQAAMFVLVAFLIICICAACLFQIHTRILDKVLPESHRDFFDLCGEEENNTLNTVREFRYSLIQMHDFVLKCNEYLSYFYALLKWDVTIPAIFFHAEICIFLIAMVMFPARWICLLIITWFFLCHKDTIVYFHRHWYSVQKKYIVKESNSLSDAGNETSAKKEVNTDTKAAGEGINEEDKDSNWDLDGDENRAMSKLEPAPSKPGMVARLLELKKRRHQMSNECCNGCKASFSPILKRRHYCRHCGNHFCNKCCSRKVPRAVFGATAPAAQTETVLVCVKCHQLLTKSSDKDKDKVS